MSAISLLTAFVALHGGFQQNKLSIDVYRLNGTSRVALQQNESLTGEVTFRVIAQTQEPIQAIEFYVGDDLRESDGSTPYEFKFDALAEDDGNVKLRFKCFTSEGKNTEKVFNLKIDNGVSLGAAVHVEKGRDFLSVKNFEAAITEGRIALRADKDNVPARLLLAQANFAQGIYDKAQKFAEDALELDKSNRTASEILISIKVQQAFGATSKSGSDRKETIDQIKNLFSKAAEIRMSLFEKDLEANQSEKTSVEYLDAAIKAKRYNLVISLLEAKLLEDVSDNELNNRLLYSYVMTGKITDANTLVTRINRKGKLNAYGLAIQAVLAAEASNDKDSDKSINDAFLDSPDSLGVKTAQAFIALKRGNPKVLADASNSLLQDKENRSEAYYYISALYNRVDKVSQGRQFFEKAIKADPSDHDMFIEQGCQAISFTARESVSQKDKEFQYDYAKAMFEVALKIRPTSAQALTGIALVLQKQNKSEDALKYAEAATKANSGYAAGWYFYSSMASNKAYVLGQGQANVKLRLDAEQKKAKSDQDPKVISDAKEAIDVLGKQITDFKKASRNALERAAACDPRNLTGAPLPDVEVGFRYFNATGRAPVLSVPAKG